VKSAQARFSRSVASGIRSLLERSGPLARAAGGRRQFRDHHLYTSSDIRRLEEAAEQVGAKAFITTEKDEQNLRSMQLFKRLFMWL